MHGYSILIDSAVKSLFRTNTKAKIDSTEIDRSNFTGQALYPMTLFDLLSVCNGTMPAVSCILKLDPVCEEQWLGPYCSTRSHLKLMFGILVLEQWIR